MIDERDDEAFVYHLWATQVVNQYPNAFVAGALDEDKSNLQNWAMTEFDSNSLLVLLDCPGAHIFELEEVAVNSKNLFNLWSFARSVPGVDVVRLARAIALFADSNSTSGEFPSVEYYLTSLFEQFPARFSKELRAELLSGVSL